MSGAGGPAGSGLWSSLRALPRAFWVLFFGTFINRAGTFVLPFLTVFMKERGFEPWQSGQAIGAWSLGSLFAGLLGGWLADRFGRNKTLAFSLFAGGASMLALSQVTTFPGLVGLLFLAGFVGEATNPATHAMVADLIPLEQRTLAYAAMRVAVNAGFALGPAVGGFLAEGSFFRLFAADAGTSAVAGVMALLFLPRGHTVSGAQASWAAVWPHVRVNRNFLAYCASVVLVGAVLRQMTAGFSLFAADNGCGTGLIGLMFAINGSLIVLFELPLNVRTRHWPVLRSIAAGFALMGGSFGLFFLGGSVAVLVTTMTVLTVGEMICLSRTSAYLASLSPPDMRGRFAGMTGLSWCVGTALGGMGGLALYQVQPAALWAACVAAGALAAGILLGFSRGPEAVKEGNRE